MGHEWMKSYVFAFLDSSTITLRHPVTLNLSWQTIRELKELFTWKRRVEVTGGAWCCSTDRPFSSPRSCLYLNMSSVLHESKQPQNYDFVTFLKHPNPDLRRKTLKIYFLCAVCVSVCLFTRFWRHYGSLSRHLMALKLQHYTKFLFVRDPFVRLISAFRNKFGRCVSICGRADREWECDCVCVPWGWALCFTFD